MRLLMTAMQAMYGEEFRRKWAGFKPVELRALWARKLAEDRIGPDAVTLLASRIDWEHPPTLPQIVARLVDIRAELMVGRETASFYKRLPAPDETVPPEEARARLAAIMQSIKRIPQ